MSRLARLVREKNLYFLQGNSIGGGATTIGKKPFVGSKFPYIKQRQIVLETRQGLLEEDLQGSFWRVNCVWEGYSFWMLTRIF